MKSNQSMQGRQLYRPRRISWFARLVWSLLLCAVTVMAPQPAAAQQSAGRVVVTGVNDSAYPTVQLSVDVFNADGAPVGNLGVNDFSVTEDGRPVAVTAVTPDASPPMALLLALDRSTDATTWSTLQTSVAGALAGLRDADQVALTTFFDEVQTVLNFTTDTTAVINALTGLTPGGEFSAVNSAAVDAVGRFTADLPARRAVLLVADAPDNISGLTTADAIGRISTANVPVYVVGVGPRVQAEASFAALAEATGGRAFAVPTADQVGPILALIIEELAQGYRLEFVSQLPADGQPHTVTVAVTGIPATGTGTFSAVPGEVTVSLDGLAAGQPVAGIVNLRVTASAPAPIASVEARVGDQVIATVSDAATPIVWDTTSGPAGQVTLAVVVVDTAGNRGEASVPLVVAQAAPRLDVVAVEDSAYPSIQVFVDAFGGNGLPLVGLTAASFAARVPDHETVVTVEVDGTQPVQMVLALDRSVSAADWVQVRSAANTLIDAMRPQDRMAVYTFGAGVSLLQGATQDANAIKSALAAVEPQAPVTEGAPPRALHQAILDAINLADTFPAGRRSVVVLTGGVDTLGQITSPTLVGLLQNGQTAPVHLLAFGVDGNSAATLAGIAQLTGGNGVSAGSSGDLRGAAQTLALLLQQGYRLDVQTRVPADERPHTVAIQLDASGVTAQAEAQFTARRGTVMVSVPSVSAGATVAGAVDLTAEASAPAPITAVSYRLNGDALAEVDDIASRILWNSDTYTPGPYTLEVTVTDAVGNQGSTTVTFTVVAPVTVEARLGPGNSDGNIVVGDEVTIDALPTAVGTLSLVEFYVDGVQVGSASQPPYRAVFDSSRFAAGTLEARVVARDSEGYEAVALLPLTLIAPAPAEADGAGSGDSNISVAGLTEGLRGVSWGRWLGIGGGILGLLLLVFGFMSLLRNARQVAAEQKQTPMRLSLSNQGNVATAYLLRGDDPAGVLTFRFSINGMPLGLPPVARLAREENGASVSAGTGNRAGGVSLGMPGGLPARAAGLSMPKNLGEVGDKLNEASMVGRIIADILISVAFFLPRQLGQPVRMIAMQIRRGQMMARRVQNVRRQMGRLQGTETGASMVEGADQAAEEAGRMVTSDETRQAVSGAGQSAGAAVGGAMGSAGRAASSLFDLTTASARQVGSQAATALGIGPGATRQWVYVPAVHPGETVRIDVVVGTQGQVRGAKHQQFRILSRALGEEDAQPVIEEGSVRVVGSSVWQRNLPRLLWVGAGVLAVVIIWVAVGFFF